MDYSRIRRISIKIYFCRRYLIIFISRRPFCLLFPFSLLSPFRCFSPYLCFFTLCFSATLRHLARFVVLFRTSAVRNNPTAGSLSLPATAGDPCLKKRKKIFRFWKSRIPDSDNSLNSFTTTQFLSISGYLIDVFDRSYFYRIRKFHRK